MQHRNISETVRNIAVLQTAFIGDIALTIPFISLIKKYFHPCNILFITTPAGYELAQAFSDIDEIIVFDKKKKHRTFSAMKNLAYDISQRPLDILFIPHMSVRSNIFSQCIRYFSPRKIHTVGYTDNAFSWLLTTRVKKKQNGHEIEKICSLMTPFTGEHYSTTLFNDWHYALRDEVCVIKDNTLYDYAQNAIVIAPASVWKTKEWGKEKWIELAHRLLSQGKKVLVIGSHADKELCQSIANITGALSVAGNTTLAQTLMLLHYAEILVCNDSAPAHLAYLAHCKVIMIYGPTVPEFGFYPPDPQSTVIQNMSLQCRPCHHHGKNECPLGTHICMKSIDVTTVQSGVESSMNGTINSKLT